MPYCSPQHTGVVTTLPVSLAAGLHTSTACVNEESTHALQLLLPACSEFQQLSTATTTKIMSRFQPCSDAAAAEASWTCPCLCQRPEARINGRLSTCSDLPNGMHTAADGQSGLTCQLMGNQVAAAATPNACCSPSTMCQQYAANSNPGPTRSQTVPPNSNRSYSRHPAVWLTCPGTSQLVADAGPPQTPTDLCVLHLR